MEYHLAIVDDDVSWDDTGHSTAAFELWLMARDDVLTFLDVTARWADDAYAQMRTHANELAADGNRDEQDEFDKFSNGLWPKAHDEALCAATYTMLVAYFEVYLEDAAQELGSYLGFRLLPDGHMDGPGWKSIKQFYARIGFNLDSEDLRRIRELRHWLAHRRSDVMMRDLGGTLAPTKPRSFDRAQVHAAAAALDGIIRSVDPDLWRATYRDEPTIKMTSIVADAENPDERLAW